MGPRWNRKAEVGIGTSILFIAMIAVSGTAGSMIVNNTSLASEQAQVVVDDTLDDTVNYLEIKSVVGVGDPDRGVLIGLELVVTLGAGSDDLNLSALVIELVLPDDHVFLGNGMEGYQVQRVIMGGLTNSTEIMGHGDMFVLRFILPTALHSSQMVKVSLVPASGLVTFVSIRAPETVTTHYISLR